MGLQDDLERFRKIGEDERQDLIEFIKHGEMQGGNNIKIPIKIIELPEFEYDQWDMGGVGQGDADQGDPVEMPEQGEGEGEEGEAGEGEGEHGYYEMNPEEFAEELDEELGLDLDPKGKQIREEKEGDLVDLARSGPDSTLDFERMYKKGLKRNVAMYFDEDYMREVLRVDGFGPSKAYKWARENNIPVSKAWLETEYNDISSDEKGVYETIDDIEMERQEHPGVAEVEDIPLRREDKRHKYPEITKEYEKNAVIVFIRDVSGSMGGSKRDLVERVFTPLDWYLTGKYDQAEFIYIAHDTEAWQTERDDFFGIESGGGTKISSAYELAQALLEQDYPWREWNRYVFAAGDGENWRNDTEENVIPLMEEINANLHGYLQTAPEDQRWGTGDHGDIVRDHFGEDSNVSVTTVGSKEDVSSSIYEILRKEGDDS